MNQFCKAKNDEDASEENNKKQERVSVLFGSEHALSDRHQFIHNQHKAERS